MNTVKLVLSKALFFILLFTSLQGFSLQPAGEPWTPQQLMEPSDLARVLNDPKATQPIIFCTGIQAVIKNSIYIGPVGNTQNLNKLKSAVEKMPRDENIVIYCGCCPFDVCPNIRPAFKMLTEMGFKNHKLLNLPRNIKVDWIDHNYPINQ